MDTWIRQEDGSREVQRMHLPEIIPPHLMVCCGKHWVFQIQILSGVLLVAVLLVVVLRNFIKNWIT